MKKIILLYLSITIIMILPMTSLLLFIYTLYIGRNVEPIQFFFVDRDKKNICELLKMLLLAVIFEEVLIKAMFYFLLNQYVDISITNATILTSLFSAIVHLSNILNLDENDPYKHTLVNCIYIQCIRSFILNILLSYITLNLLYIIIIHYYYNILNMILHDIIQKIICYYK